MSFIQELGSQAIISVLEIPGVIQVLESQN